ncbi:hypothetical protein FRC04_009023 [Tulasnella sp. 424]|nr:hypothetical protein FRC04_009023 [Tulasnella sp. 424]
MQSATQRVSSGSTTTSTIDDVEKPRRKKAKRCLSSIDPEPTIEGWRTEEDSYREESEEGDDDDEDDDDDDDNDDEDDEDDEDDDDEGYREQQGGVSALEDEEAPATALSTPSDDEDDDPMWALHEDHRQLRNLCTAAADSIGSSSVASDTAQVSKSDLERLCSLRYQLAKRSHLDEDEIQDLEKMLERILVVKKNRMDSLQGVVEKSVESLQRLGDTNFTRLHKRFEIR